MRLFEKQKKKIKRVVLGLREKLDWWGDGLGVRGKNLGFLTEPRFVKSYKFAHDGNVEGWAKAGSVPQIQWRAHVCCWAAKNALRLDGDFIECGVHTGILSMTVCDYLEFDKLDRRFLLFDTFNGIPTSKLDGPGRFDAEQKNGLYFDVYDLAKRNFARFANVELIRGELPNSLDGVEIKRVAYLSMDLNSAQFERDTIEVLWNKLVPGAMVILDDYAFMGHVPQYEMWNEFAASRDRMILTVPTGQGILQK